MARTVLVAVHLESPAYWAISYAIQLAARLRSSVVLMVVTRSSLWSDKREPAQIYLAGLKDDQRLWLDQAVARCQREGVNMEIFFSCGPFFQEVIRFVQVQSSVDFIVMGLPSDSPKRKRDAFPASIMRLHDQFAGEILLVQEREGVTQLAKRYPHNAGKGN